MAQCVWRPARSWQTDLRPTASTYPYHNHDSPQNHQALPSVRGAPSSVQETQTSVPRSSTFSILNVERREEDDSPPCEDGRCTQHVPPKPLMRAASEALQGGRAAWPSSPFASGTGHSNVSSHSRKRVTQTSGKQISSREEDLYLLGLCMTLTQCMPQPL